MCSPTSDDRPYSLTNSNSTLAAAVNVTAARPAIAPQLSCCVCVIVCVRRTACLAGDGDG
jgi:hypothetical protein